MEDKRSVIDWIKTHKTELIIAGITTTACIGAWFLFKNDAALLKEIRKVMAHKNNYDELLSVPNALEPVTYNVLSDAKEEIKIIDVQEHLRNLPSTWNASADKQAEAAIHGFDLAPHQTWVNPYTKKVA